MICRPIKRPILRALSGMAIALFLSLFLSHQAAYAASAGEINIKVDSALQRFKKEVSGGSRFISNAKGVLVFPDVIKAGFGVGGEYGEGVLRINGESKAYYSIASGSFGFQMGAQKASYIIAFASAKALENFRRSNGWEAGVDGAITIVNWGAGKDIGSISFEKPIYAFVFNSKGLMGSFSLEGTKFTKIKPGATAVYDEVENLTQ